MQVLQCEAIEILIEKVESLEDFTTNLDIGGRLNKIRADEMQVRIEKLEDKEEV